MGRLLTIMYFIIYKDGKGEWRWKFRAANHEDIGVSSEGYTRRENCVHSINLVKTGSPGAKVYDDTSKSWI